MNYIVFDLEWNQGNTEREGEEREIPFEIVEIGAVKLNDAFEITGEFSRLIKPQIYHEMNQITTNLIHLKMEELEDGKYFRLGVGKHAFSVLGEPWIYWNCRKICNIMG